MATARIPVSTCRLQLDRSFGFRDVMLNAACLRKLGISDVYLSPIFKARPGSAHGYDITDPRVINPELGDRRNLWGNEYVPDPDMEMLIYQSILGAWPFIPSEIPEFRERFKAYVIKAAREAKKHTSWLSVNSEYEEALVHFAGAILDLPAHDRFLQDCLDFQQRIAFYGVFNSLSQVVLKATSPGVADFYRGTELWDLSLVDPDNRRPVDFELRRAMLDNLDRENGAPALEKLLLAPEDGLVKLYTVVRTLRARVEDPDLFLKGDYLPLEASGGSRGHIAAFARRYNGRWAVAVAPRLLTRLVQYRSLPLGERTWYGDGVRLSPEAPQSWLNIFTGRSVEVDGSNRLQLSEVFQSFPVALLLGRNTLPGPP